VSGRKGSLIAAAKAASERVAAEAAAPVPDVAPAPSVPAPAPVPSPPPEPAATPTVGYVTTAIHVPKDVLMLLRRVAMEGAGRDGGRPSVSAVLVDLVRAHRDELERDAER
jgi:hypothetical protein